MKLLLVEDDLDLGNGIRIALSEQGLDVTWVRRLREADALLTAGGCDLVLLDLGLPDGDGLTLLRRLRRQRDPLPVLVVTARDALDDRLQGLDCGADDYLVKPFALAELVARVRALARRSYGFDRDGVSVRGIEVRERMRRVTVDGTVVDLSPTEYGLLLALVRRPGHVLTRTALTQLVLADRGDCDDPNNLLDVHMSNLRRKIGGSRLRTVRGIGYVIDADEPARKPAALPEDEA